MAKQEQGSASQFSSSEDQMPARPFVNYYHELGVSVTASPGIITSAYHQKLTETGATGNDSLSLSKQIELDDAYHILTHRYKKTVYDKLNSEQLLKDERAKMAREKVGSIPKLKAWRVSLEIGGEEGEAEYGRIARLKKEELDEKDVWAPSLMSGEVAGFGGWED